MNIEGMGTVVLTHCKGNLEKRGRRMVKEIFMKKMSPELVAKR